jgi:hypothetical protein
LAGEVPNEDGPPKGEEPEVLLLVPNPPPNAAGDAPNPIAGGAPKPKDGGATGATPKPETGGVVPNPPKWVGDGVGGGEPNGGMLGGAGPKPPPPKPDMLKVIEHFQSPQGISPSIAKTQRQDPCRTHDGE